MKKEEIRMSVFVIWDWDATLADTYPVINKAYAHTYKMLGMEKEVKSFDEIKRITSTLQNKDVLECVFGLERKEDARKIFYEYIGKNHANTLEPIKGAYVAMEYLAKIGAESMLLSNKTNTDKDGRGKYLEEELNKLEMLKYFSAVSGAGEKEEDKPSLAAIKGLIDKSSKKPTKNDLILVIGDGEADMKVAENLRAEGFKVRSVLLDPKNKYKGSIRPNYIVHELNTLPIILQNETNGVAEIARRKQSLGR